jgi:ribonuclease HI
MRKKYFAIRWQSGEVEIIHDTWNVVKEKVTHVSNVTFKSFNYYPDALAWVEQVPIPFRKAGDPLEKDTLYFFVDGSYSGNRKMAGWGWVAVVNDDKIGEDYGIVTNEDFLSSRNIAGELQAATEAASWYVKNIYPEYGKPIIVHDYAGIANWHLGYWDATKPVSVEYCRRMCKYENYFNFEKVNGHTGDKWNDYADELTRKGYDEKFSS